MINISTELKDLFKHDYAPYRTSPAHKELTMTFTNPLIVIGNTKRKADTFSLDECLCDGESLKFGDCQASIMKFTCADVTDDIVGKEFVCVESVGSIDIDFGVYKVYSAEKTDDLRYKAITAYDRMKEFDINVIGWYNNLNFPLTQKQFRDSLCEYIGIEQEVTTLVNDSMPITKTIDAEVLNGLAVLKAICEINGCFGHMSRTGALQYIVLSKEIVDDTIPKETIHTVQHEEYTVQAIDKLQICQEDGDIGAIVGTGSNCYKITGNFLCYGKTAGELATIAQNASINIFGIAYKPYNGDLYGLPYLEVGDCINLGDKFTSYILHRTLTGVQSLKDTFEAKGSEKLVEVVTVNEEIKQLKGKSSVLKRTVEELSNTITDLSTNIDNNYSTTEQMQSAITQNNSTIETNVVNKVDKKYIGLLPSISLLPSDTLLPCSSTILSDLTDQYNTMFRQTSKEFNWSVKQINSNIDTLSSEMSLSAQQFRVQINNLAESTAASLEMLDNAISLKVSSGDVSNQLSIETGGINITGNRFTWSATNSSMTQDGTLTCQNINLSGTIASAGLVTESGDRKLVIGNGGFNWYYKDEFEIDLREGGIIVHDKYNNQATTIGGSSVDTRYINATLGMTCGGNTVLTTATGSSIYHGHSTTSLSASLGASATYSGTYYLYFSNTSGDGNIPTIGWVKARAASDERLKCDITDLIDITDKYMRLKPVSYRFKNHVNDNSVHYGFIAQDVEKVYPNSSVVEYDEDIKTEGERIYIPGDDGVYRLNDREFHALHVQIIQKQQRELEQLKSTVEELESLLKEKMYG